MDPNTLESDVKVTEEDKTFLDEAKEQGFTTGVAITVRDNGMIDIMSSYDNYSQLIYILERAKIVLLNIENSNLSKAILEAKENDEG